MPAIPAVVGLATTAATVKKQKDAKKQAQAQAKAAEAQARAEEAAAARAAAEQAKIAAATPPTPVVQPQAQPYGIPQYGAPVYYQPPAYAPQQYGAPAYAYPQYGAPAYAQPERSQARRRQDLTVEDSRSIQMSKYRQQIDAKLAQFRTALSRAEREYGNAYRSGNREAAIQWYDYYNQVQAAISELESQQIQYAA